MAADVLVRSGWKLGSTRPARERGDGEEVGADRMDMAGSDGGRRRAAERQRVEEQRKALQQACAAASWR